MLSLKISRCGEGIKQIASRVIGRGRNPDILRWPAPAANSLALVDQRPTGWFENLRPDNLPVVVIARAITYSAVPLSVSSSTVEAPTWRLKALSRPKALSFHIQVSNVSHTFAKALPWLCSGNVGVPWHAERKRSAAIIQLLRIMKISFLFKSEFQWQVLHVR